MQLRELLKKEIPLKFENNGILTVETVKRIYQKAVSMNIDSLTQIRSEYFEKRIEYVNEI